MKAIWYDDGDPSVGLMGGSYEIDLGDWEPWSREHREEVRKGFQWIHLTMWDEDFGQPMFSDECGDCGEPMDDGKCMNKRCIMNMPPEEDEW